MTHASCAHCRIAMLYSFVGFYFPLLLLQLTNTEAVDNSNWGNTSFFFFSGRNLCSAHDAKILLQMAELDISRSSLLSELETIKVEAKSIWVKLDWIEAQTKSGLNWLCWQWGGGVLVFNASVETSYDVNLFNLEMWSAKWFQRLWVNTFLSLIFHSSALSWV